MDLDAYVRAHQPAWQRLDQLGRRRPSNGAEADELVDLYREVATHLSVIRSTAPDPSVVTYLSSLLARARTGRPGPGRRLERCRGLLRRRFPAALYRTRRWWLTTMMPATQVSAVMIWWLLQHAQVEQTFLEPAEIDQLVNSDFENYYSGPRPRTSLRRCGPTTPGWPRSASPSGCLGLPVIYLLWQNMVDLALIGSIMIRNDRGDLFFGLILPHGLLELTAVFVAAVWACACSGRGSRRGTSPEDSRSQPRGGLPAAWRWAWPLYSSCRGSSRPS